MTLKIDFTQTEALFIKRHRKWKSKVATYWKKIFCEIYLKVNKTNPQNQLNTMDTKLKHFTRCRLSNGPGNTREITLIIIHVGKNNIKPKEWLHIWNGKKIKKQTILNIPQFFSWTLGLSLYWFGKMEINTVEFRRLWNFQSSALTTYPCH